MNIDKTIRDVVNNYNNTRSSDEEEIMQTTSLNANDLLKLLKENNFNGFEIIANPFGKVDFEFKTPRESLILTAEDTPGLITLEQTPYGIFNPYIETFDITIEESKDQLLKIIHEITQ